MVRKTITTEVRGGQCGEVYDDKELLKTVFETTVITRIVLSYGDYVSCIAMSYSCLDSVVMHEGSYPSAMAGEILLASDEYIVKMTGWSSSGEGVAGHLEFTSNHGNKWGPFGRATRGEAFTWDYTETGMGLLYFSGSFACTLRHLQATFAECPGPSPPVAKVIYEPRTITGQPATEAPLTLSRFARYLLSPVILLQVGPTPVTFHVYEAIICGLPFFQAAIHSGFREATDNVIAMPEDDPETVASLLEFLYLGTYAYTYACDGPSQAEMPAKDIAEASFHVRLHALARKYDCTELVALERRSVACVLEGLDGMQLVMVVKEMHESGWGVREWDEEVMGPLKKRIPQVMRGLYETCDEELEGVLAGCPRLAQDLLRLVVLS